MLWGPESWDASLTGEPLEGEHAARAKQALRATLAGLPGRRGLTVADLGCGSGRLIPFLAARYGRVIAVDYAPATLAGARQRYSGEGVRFRRRDLRDLTPFRNSFDVAVAVGSVVGPRQRDVDRILGQIWNSLRHGGIFLATFPAAALGGGPVPMIPEDAGAAPRPLRFHEVELQYRLRRAGFRGVRIRRFADPGPGPGTLLVQAVRRADN